MRRQAGSTALAVAALAAAALLAIGPALWALSTALKPFDQILAYPPNWLPHPPSLESVRQVLSQSSIPIYFRNSVIVTAASLVVSLAIGAHAAYAIARYRFWGRSALLVGLLATSMIPGIAILVPLYHLSVLTGLYNSFTAQIIVYSAWNVPILMWLLKGFFESVPKDIEEAAWVDGCSRLRAFYTIALRMARPGILSGAIMVIIFVWNDFLITFTLTISDSRRLLSVGLYTYISNYGIQWGQLMAATIISLVPVVAAFFLLQKYLVEGLMAGAVKG
jgi:ABC-type glycerol-3-phosphate transport system permease component